MSKAQGWGFMWCWMQFKSLLLLEGGYSSFFVLHFLPRRHMPLMLALHQCQRSSCTYFKSGSVCLTIHIRKQSQQKSEWSPELRSWVSFLGHLACSDELHTKQFHGRNRRLWWEKKVEEEDGNRITACWQHQAVRVVQFPAKLQPSSSWTLLSKI